MDLIAAPLQRIPRSQLAAFAGFAGAYIALQSVGPWLAGAAGAAASQARAARAAAPAAPAAAPEPAAAPAKVASENAPQELAGLHYTDCVECAELIAEKIEERVALARSKHAAGEEFDKAVTVLWGISVGKKNIFEEHDTTQAEFDASCEALLNGGGVGSRGADLGALRAVRSPLASALCPCYAAPCCQALPLFASVVAPSDHVLLFARAAQALRRVDDAKDKWNKLLADADEDINKKAGVRGRFKVGESAPMDVALTGRNGERTTMGELLNEPRHAAGLLLVVLRHFG